LKKGETKSEREHMTEDEGKVAGTKQLSTSGKRKETFPKMERFT
jgi:hypothetical protein